jgi:putative salt-induced outer membrane protein
MRKATMALALMGLAPALALAETPAKPWTGEGEVAYLKSTGSSEQETFKGFSDTRYQHNAWTHQLRLEGVNSSDGLTDQRTRERYFVLEKSSWNFTPRDYLFVKPQYEKDLQSAYSYQAMISAGYGHKFFDTETLKLSLDIGAGTRFSKLEATGDVEDEAVGNTALKFEWAFRPGARFTEDVAVDSGEDSTVTRTRSALIFALSDILGMVIAYETKNDDGPLTVKDTLTSVGLNYRIK